MQSPKFVILNQLIKYNIIRLMASIYNSPLQNHLCNQLALFEMGTIMFHFWKIWYKKKLQNGGRS